jgi:hypothetical protein
MPSSTSNSEPMVETYERPVPVLRWGVAGALAVAMLLGAMAYWEMHWRKWGAQPTYRNSEGLWALQRKRINQGEGHKTVLIGSSRTLSNINLDVWEKVAGERPIQLALEGTSPLPVLEGLADDPDFKGRVVVGVSSLLFFSGFEFRHEVLEYYPKETPSQRFGQWLSMTLLEPYLAFYDQDFALFTVIKRQSWPKRAGIRADRDVRRLFTASRDRNMRMWEKVETDAAYQQLCKDIWKEFWDPPDMKIIPEIPKMRARQLDRAEAVAKKLKARGIPVVFVLHPVDGEFKHFELDIANKREDTWEPLLQRTGLPGLHYQDHPEMQGYWLPEWSHMSRADADRYTVAVYPLIQQKLEEGKK